MIYRTILYTGIIFKYNACRFQFVPRDTMVIIAWSLANVKMITSSAIQPRVVFADMDTQVHTILNEVTLQELSSLRRT